MNLPTKITVARLALVPVYVALFLLTDWKLMTTLVFVLASYTDFLDGYLARKMNLVSDLGKLLDPLADKILTMSAFILFVSIGRLSPVPVILVIARELLISIFRAIAASKNHVIAASIYGKIKTILQIVLLIALHVFWTFQWSNHWSLEILICAMSAVTVFSAAEYIWKNREVMY